MEIEEQLHKRPAFPSEASTCIMEAHQVDACINVPEEISKQRNWSSGCLDDTASPMMAHEASQKSSAEMGDDSTAHAVVANSVESPHHRNLSSQEADLVVEEEHEEESTQTDNAEGESYFDINDVQKDNEFFLYLLVSPRPKTVRASSFHGHKSESIQLFQPLKLPEQARPYVGNYTCWRLCIPLSFSRMGFQVMVTFPKAKLLGAIPLPGSKEPTLFKFFERRRRIRMQIESFHKQEPGNREHLKLALNSILVLLSTPMILSDCFAECALLNTRIYHGHIMSDSDLKRTCDWLAWIQQEFQEPVNTDRLNIEWASKMVPALLGQFHLVKQLLLINELPKFLKEHCVKLLQLFANVVLQLGSLQLLPSGAATTMQQFVADLVHLTPASQWSLHLYALCNADPRYSFLKRWKARWDDIRMEKDQCEVDYEDAIFHILNFCETYHDENFKLKAIKAAILATPSGITFLRSIHLLLCSNLLPDMATVEEVEGFLSGDYGQALISHFKWLMDRESPMIMVRLLIKELSSNGSKVLRTFIRILNTILLRWNILALTKRFGKMDSPKVSFDNLIEIWACPHTFIIPLLSDETILLYDIASKGDLEVAAYVILALVKKVVSAESLQNKGGIWDNLRTWLHKVCARAADAIKESTGQAPMTPHALYSKVANLFGEGLQSAGFLAEAIDEVVSRLVQQRFRLQEVIQDAGKMSFLDCDEIAQHYCSFAIKALSKDLYAYKDVGYEGLDSRATELLNWLCTRAQGDMSVNGWIQEALCTFLLDVLNDIGAENPSACDGTLVESTFKFLLLQLNLAPRSHVMLHPFYQSLLMEWTTLEKELEEQSILLGRVIKIMNHPLTVWEYVCKVHKASSKALTNAITEVTCYMNTSLKAFNMLLDYAMLIKGCVFTSRDLHEAHLWLEQRYNRYKDFTLREMKDPDHWPIKLDAQFFDAMLILRRSKILENIFKRKAFQVSPMCLRSENEEERDDEPDNDCCISGLFPDEEEIMDKHDTGNTASGLWQYAASIMRISLDCYVEEWKNLSSAFYPVEKLSDLLCGLTNNEIDEEGNLAEGFLRFWQEQVPQNFQAVLAALTAWVNLHEKKALVAPLVKVERMLNIDEDDSRLSATLQSLCDACIVGSLGEYVELYNSNVEAIDYFSSKESVVIKQIADSEKLISFLKERSSDDFRLLTDAIEEQEEDVLVDETTISDLIHIDKVFRPLLKSEKVRLAHLKSTLVLETQNLDSAQLCSKLSFCTINIHRIQQFVTSLADRSSVLRMNMHSIMHSGVYDVAIVSQRGLDGYCHEVAVFL
ncbi:hypothetical protein L7F22_054215 [Adiantum nelumboides]|nr:hypothetical protein [Adiantum nelumboides]